MELNFDKVLSPEFLASFQYKSIEEAGMDMLLLSAQAKYSEYLAEHLEFERKYQMDFPFFQEMTDRQTNEENFEQEDDLMDWRFAYEGLRYWAKKIEELKSCFSR